MASLVIAEHDNENLTPDTLSTLAAARELGADVHVLVAGHNCRAVAEAAASAEGVTKVLLCDNEGYEHALAENLAPLAAGLAADYSHILGSASTFGKNFMPRVAVALDVAQISDIVAVESEDTFVRPIYAGNALATVKSNDATKVITVRGTGFDPVAPEGSSAEIEDVEAGDISDLAQFKSQELTQSDRPDLGSATIVISGGRGLQSGENFALLEEVADKMGAAIGASRAAVDAGYIGNDHQVGQTGKIIAPDLYIAVGISGAIQHLAGMEESKTIVAINKDEEAPIFEIADYALVGDLFEIMPELSKALDSL